MIRFLDVSVRYGGAPNRALDGVSIDVPEGEVTAVAGPNGSGKSTLVRALLRRQPLESGSIEVSGDNVNVISAQEIARRVAAVDERFDAAFAAGFSGLNFPPYFRVFGRRLCAAVKPFPCDGGGLYWRRNAIAPATEMDLSFVG